MAPCTVPLVPGLAGIRASPRLTAWFLQLPSSPLPTPVAVPALPPRLPRASGLDSPALAPQAIPAANGLLSPVVVPPRPPASPMPSAPGPPPLTNDEAEKSSVSADYTGNSLRLTQDDIHQIGRFVREFVTMSLLPWMEKCVVEWNESVRYSTYPNGATC